jgi:CPA2 family monovalent cation:H+ antiporter-2
VHPLRDAFGAMFFFAFGVSIDPRDVRSVAVPVLVAVLITIVMNVAAGLIAARLHHCGPPEAANIGLIVLARGEFALVLGAMAATAGLDPRLAPFISGYVLLLAVAGPLAATRSDWLAQILPNWRGTPAPEPVREPALTP